MKDVNKNGPLMNYKMHGIWQLKSMMDKNMEVQIKKNKTIVLPVSFAERILHRESIQHQLVT